MARQAKEERVAAAAQSAITARTQADAVRLETARTQANAQQTAANTATTAQIATEGREPAMKEVISHLYSMGNW